MTSDAGDFSYEPETVPAGALFVAADEPLLVFPSVAAAERALEATDVKDGVYPAAYGPNGEPYRIGWQRNRVIIERMDGPNRPEAMRALLLRYLDQAGRNPDPAATLEEVVAAIWAAERSFWLENDPYGERFGYSIPLWGCMAFLAAVAAAIWLALR